MSSSQNGIQWDRFCPDLHALKPKVDKLVPGLWLENMHYSMHYSMLHAKPSTPL